MLFSKNKKNPGFKVICYNTVSRQNWTNLVTGGIFTVWAQKTSGSFVYLNKTGFVWRNKFCSSHYNYLLSTFTCISIIPRYLRTGMGILSQIIRKHEPETRR